MKDLIDLNRLGEFWREKRKLAGLTQRYVSKQFNYTSPQFVSNWERGLIAPPMKTAVSLIKLYDVCPCEGYRTYIEAIDEELRSAFGVSKKDSVLRI